MISIGNSKKNVDHLIKQIEEYKENLHRKQTEFVEKLAELGIPIINENVAASEGDSSKDVSTYIAVAEQGNTSTAYLVVNGQDIVFIEFGAGVHYNTPVGESPHPKGEEFGYTIGSYGQGHGAQDEWRYRDYMGTWVYTHGTQATMPVYKSALEMRQKVLEVARQVFGST